MMATVCALNRAKVKIEQKSTEIGRPGHTYIWIAAILQVAAPCKPLSFRVSTVARMPFALLVNHLDSKGNYNATSNNTKLAHWQLISGLLHLVYSDEDEGPGRAAAPPSPLLAVPNVTAHPSTASVPNTVLLYDGPLLCQFNVAIKG